jgi:hypothetical protein
MGVRFSDIPEASEAKPPAESIHHHTFFTISSPSSDNPAGRNIPTNGAKIEQARQATLASIDLLCPEDVFSLVAYGSDVETLIAPRVVGKNTKPLKSAGSVQPDQRGYCLDP